MTLFPDSGEWSYRSGRLFCEDVELKTIAKAAATPVYVYSHAHLLERFEKMKKAWGRRRHLICFSVKSNPNLAVIRTLASQGAGMDVVSAGELFLALQAGVSPDRIVFAGVGKTREEIRRALLAGILFFTVESFPELYLINAVAREVDRIASIALRVTPGIAAGAHRYITTGLDENKFGIDADAALEFFRQCENLPQVKAVGIHMHLGSQILTVRPYVEGVKKLLGIMNALEGKGVSLSYLDLGGGMGVSYRGEVPPAPAAYAAAIAPLLKDVKATLVLEPGRYFTGNMGCLVVRVTYLKKKARKNFVIVDGGMNDLIRPALYGAYHQVLPLEEEERKTITADQKLPGFLETDRG
ncbi:MAG: diaminopimelate decarboxylase [Candidatus Aureabacteria bacterium]|nr:diaminopimelate decarboxylase [Candidatus Auribacterota bacterium]